MGPFVLPFPVFGTPGGISQPLDVRTALPSDEILGIASIPSKKPSAVSSAASSKVKGAIDVSGELALATAFLGGGGQVPNMSANPTSGADGRSGNATSTSTFGDFIVNGSKGDISNILIVVAGAVLVMMLLKKGKK